MEDDPKVTDTVPHAGEETAPNTPPPVPETHHANDELTATVHRLEETVNSLATTVQSLVQEGQDSSPVKKPWTSRKLWA